MKFSEAEDFTLHWGTRFIGRFIVASVEPYYVDIEEEYKKHYNVYRMIEDLEERGIIEYYKPNFEVSINMFDDNIEVKRNEYKG